MMKFHKRRAAAVFATAAALGIALSGCSLLNIGGSDTARDEDGNVTEEGTIDVFSLKLGDCLPAEGAGAGEISDVQVVPCDEPHESEVYHEFTLDEGDGSFPGDDVIDAAVEEQCLGAFETFVGIPYDDSTLTIGPITPTEDTWTSLDDRLVQCLIYDPATTELTGSLEGAAR